MNERANHVNELIQDAQKYGYPQAVEVQVRWKNRVVLEKSFGKSYRFWDVASLTKVLVTTPLLMTLYEKNLVDLKEPLLNSLPFLKNSEVGEIPVERLLSHASGLVAFRAYEKQLVKVPWTERDRTFKGILRKEKVHFAGKCVYSDVDFILLGWIIEQKLGMPLDEAAQKYLWEPLGLKNTFYLRKGDKLPGPKSAFAPTEKHPYRGVLQGIVFDERAWSMGGVSGHAGLFSTLKDVGRIGQEYLNGSLGAKTLWKPATFKKFSTRAVPQSWGDWALGFTIPTRPISTGGRLISSAAFGHTGFTGTSLWVDRSRKAVVTILSNRTYPNRSDVRFRDLRINIHDAVWEMIDAAR